MYFAIKSWFIGAATTQEPGLGLELVAGRTDMIGSTVADRRETLIRNIFDLN